MKLIIGNKNYSSWSFRPWLFLKMHEISFEEERIALDTEHTAKQIAHYNPAGKVPVLLDRDMKIWDSLAICEYLSEQYLNGRGWPQDFKLRAEARSCSAEMHSGFFLIREQMPMNCRSSGRRITISTTLQKELTRIDSMWSKLRDQHQAKGPWLFGEFSIADCMFAPVVFRFTTYGVAVSENAKQYMGHVLSSTYVQEWKEAAESETEVIEKAEAGR